MANIEGAITGNVMEVDSSKNLKINLPSGQTQAGYLYGVIDYDTGVMSLMEKRNHPWVTYDRRLSVGLDTPYYDYTFNATAQDTGCWRYVTATMTTTWGTGGMLMNAISTVTTATGTAVSSWRTFPLTGNGTIVVDMSLNITATPLMGQVVEFGLFPFGAGTTAPTEGVYFRLTSAGLIGICNFNGIEATTGVMLPIINNIIPNTTNSFTIRINERIVSFWIDGELLYSGELLTASAQGQPYITTELPVTFQFRNSGTVNGTIIMQLKVLDVSIDQKSISINKLYSHIQAGKGFMGSQGLNGGTMGTTALYSNSLAAGAGTILSNTAALVTGLGGQGGALGTLAVPTDGIVCSYQVPVGGVNQVPRTLYITGVKVNCGVTTILAGGPMIYAMSLVYGHTAVSLATAEAVAAKAPRRVPLGFLSLVANAAAGVATPELYIPFNSPIVVSPGEFVAIVAKNLGTVTTTGVIVFQVTYDSYLE